MVRQLDKTHFLYMNVNGGLKEIKIKENSRSAFYEKDNSGNVTIVPYEPEFIEIK